MVSTQRSILTKFQCHLTHLCLNNHSARKSLRQFSEVLNVKPQTAVRRLGAAKSNRKAIISGSILWYSIQKRQGNTKINLKVKKYIYDWVIYNTQVFQYPMVNDCLKLYAGGHQEPQMVPNMVIIGVCMRTSQYYGESTRRC